MRKVFQFLGQALAAFILIAGAVVLLGGVLVPLATGSTTYAVLANSMAPRYPMGTLMVVRPAQTINTGDVVTYQLEPNDPTVVTHRVIAVGSTIGGEPRFTTQGDANEIADPAPVQPEQIRGVLWYSIPFAGFLVVALDGWREYAKLGAAGLLAIYAIWQVVRYAQERNKAAKGHDAAATPELVAENYAPELATLGLVVPADAKPVHVEPAPVAAPSSGVQYVHPTMAEYVAPVVNHNPVEGHLNTDPVFAPFDLDAAVAAIESCMPTMTRAERRRLAALAAAQQTDTEFELLS